MLWINCLAFGSFLVLSPRILHFHKKNIAVLDISWFTFCEESVLFQVVFDALHQPQVSLVEK